MKRIFILALIVFTTSSINAQVLEFGVNVGGSTNGNPSDNMVYKGKTSTFNYAGSMSLLVNMNEYVQIGLEARVMELSRISDSVYLSPYKIPIGNDGKKFVYAKFMTSAMFLINGQLSIGEAGKVYGGAALGYGVGRHDSRKIYSGEDYRAPDGGKGFAYGAQLGVLLDINKHVAFKLEGAFRNFNLNYKDTEAPIIRPIEDLNYSITAINVTVGLTFNLETNLGRHIPLFGGSRDAAY